MRLLCETVESLWDSKQESKPSNNVRSRSSGWKEEWPPKIPEEQKRYITENQLLHERIKKLEQSNWDLKESK